MTSRERVRKAINHQVSDRVPVGLGSTAISSIHVISLNRLRKKLHLEERLSKALDPLLWIGDVEDWLIAIFERPEYLCELYDMQADIAIENLKLYKEAVGDKIDVIALSGTDFAHQNTNWKTFMHSCGAVSELIPEFIASGYDILNPVQVSAVGMDAKTLKEKYGRDIVFWGGGCNPQGTINRKSKEEVYEETRRNAEILSRGGGYIGGNVHNIQYDVPAENIIAEFQALRDTVPQEL